MKSIAKILAEKAVPKDRSRRLDREEEGRTEMFYIGYDARDGFNMYCVVNGKAGFKSIEKMKDNEAENFAVKLEKGPATKKLAELEKQFPDLEDLEIRSEHELAKFFI